MPKYIVDEENLWPFSEPSPAGNGYLQVSEANLNHLEEFLLRLQDHWKFYDEFPRTKQELLSLLSDIQACAAAVRRSSR